MATGGGGGFLLARAFVEITTPGFSSVTAQLASLNVMLNAVTRPRLVNIGLNVTGGLGGISAAINRAIAALTRIGPVATFAASQIAILSNSARFTAGSLMMLGHAASFAAGTIGIMSNSMRLAALWAITMSGQVTASAAAMTAAMNALRTAMATAAVGANTLRTSMGGIYRMIVAIGALRLGWYFVKAAADMQSSEARFTVMLRSGEKARALLVQLRQFATVTPFTFPGLREVATGLIGTGSAAGDVIRQIKMLGDISAGTGKPIWQLAAAFGRIQQEGVLTGRTMQRLQNALVGGFVVEELGKKFKKTNAEIIGMISRRQIKFSDVEEALTTLTQKGSIFYNLMSVLNAEFLGQLSNLADNFLLIATLIGNVLAPVAIGTLNVINYLMREWKGTIGVVILILGSLTVVLLAVSAAQRLWNAMQIIGLALQGPKGIAQLAVAAAVATAGIIALRKAYVDMADEVKKASETDLGDGEKKLDIAMEKESKFTFVGLTEFTKSLQQKLGGEDDVAKNTKNAADELAKMNRDGVKIRNPMVQPPAFA